MTCVIARHAVSMGHRLPSYNGICSSLHGHNVLFTVAADNEGRFLDFKVLAAHLNDVIRDFDHALVLFDQDPLIHADGPGQILLQNLLPSQRLVLLNVEPTTEALAEYVFEQMCLKGYDVTKVHVQETDRYSAVCQSRPVTPPIRIAYFV